MKTLLQLIIKHKTLWLMSAFVAGSVMASAATYTAVLNGNWSNSNTWGGNPPGTTISAADSVIIPAGITVNLDVDVMVMGALANLAVNGYLSNTAGARMLYVMEGAVTGSGSIVVYELRFESLLASISFTGSIDARLLVNDGANLTLNGTTLVRDTLDLLGGNMALGNGANLSVVNNGVIKRDNGTLSTAGGTMNSGTSYHVLYIGSSKSSGVEINSNVLQNVYIRLADTSQVLTMASNLRVNKTLFMDRGKLSVDSYIFSLYGDLITGIGSAFMSNQNSEIGIYSDTTLSNNLLFTPGSSVRNLFISINKNGNARLVTPLIIQNVLRLTRGILRIESGGGALRLNANSRVSVYNGILSLNGGTFSGNDPYDVEYTGTSTVTSIELTGSGLRDVTINLVGINDSLRLESPITAGGFFHMVRGKLLTNGKIITLNGTFDQTVNSAFVGHPDSELLLNLSSAAGDTLRFDPADQNLKKLVLNLPSAGTFLLGSPLNILEELKLTRGRIDIANHDLAVLFPGTISAYNDTSYVVTSGTGKLQMRVISAGSSVTFPVGTSDNYSPAYIQQGSSGATGDFKVRTLPGVFSQGTSGVNIAGSNKVVNRSWIVETATAFALNMNLRLGWKPALEVNGFNRSQAYISRYIAPTWDVYVNGSAVSGPFGTYQLSRAGLTATGTAFAVADSANPLSSRELRIANGPEIFPNPARDFITLRQGPGWGDYIFEVMDFTGRVVVSGTSQEEPCRLDISHLQAGYYFLRISRPDNVQVILKRFAKE